MSNKIIGWLVGLFVFTVVAINFLAPSFLRHVDYGSTSTVKLLPGEWVGPVLLRGTYKPDLYGKTPGPHTQGTLYLDFRRASSRLDWTEGKGEICITGEPNLRTIDLSVDSFAPGGQVNPDGSITIQWVATPHLGAFPWTARFTHAANTPDTLTVGNNIELGMQGTLHRSTRDAFRAQVSCTMPWNKE